MCRFESLLECLSPDDGDDDMISILKSHVDELSAQRISYHINPDTPLHMLFRNHSQQIDASPSQFQFLHNGLLVNGDLGGGTNGLHDGVTLLSRKLDEHMIPQ